MPAMTKQPNLLVMYGITAEINTAPDEATEEWSTLCAGFNNLTEALNEVINQYFFLCQKGFANNYVTGMAPVATLTGVRIVGDAAQEFIFGAKYKTLANRETQLRLTRANADGTTTSVITVNVTMQNIQEFSGATTDGSAISVEFAFNGEPTLSQGTVGGE